MSKNHNPSNLVSQLAKLQSLNKKLKLAKLQKSNILNKTKELDSVINTMDKSKQMLSTGKMSVDEYSNMMIETNLKSADILYDPALQTEKLSAAYKQAIKINKDLKIIFKAFNKNKDFKLMTLSIIPCINKLEDLKRAATSASDITGLQKIFEIANNVFWIFTGESATSLQNGRKRIFEIINWLISKIELEHSFDGIVNNKINYNSVKSIDKSCLELSNKWDDLGAWIITLQHVKPFLEPVNIDYLIKVSDLCKARSNHYNEGLKQCNDVLSKILKTCVLIENFSFSIIPIIKDGIIKLETDEYLKGLDHVVNSSDIQYIKDIYIPYSQRVIKQINRLHAETLTTTPYLSEFTELSMKVNKNLIDFLHTAKVGNNKEFDLDLAKVKVMLVSFYDDMNKVHKLLNKSSLNWLEEINSNINVLIENMNLLDKAKKKSYIAFTTRIPEILIDNANSLPPGSEKILNNIKSNIRISNKNSQINKSPFEIQLNQLRQSLLENEDNFESISELGVPFGVVSNKFRKVIQTHKPSIDNLDKADRDSQFRRRALDQTKEAIVYDSNEELYEALESDFKEFLITKTSELKSIELRELFLRIICHSIIPCERVLNSTSFLQNMLLENKDNTLSEILTKIISTYTNFVNDLYKTYLANEDKFIYKVNLSLTSLPMNITPPTFDFSNKYSEIESHITKIKEETIPLDSIFSFIDQLVFYSKKIFLYSIISDLNRSVSKIWEIQLTFFCYGRTIIEVAPLRESLTNETEHSNRLEALFTDLQAIATQSNGLGTNALKKLATFIISYKNKIFQYQDHEKDLFEGLEIIDSNNLKDEEFLQKIQNILELAVNHNYEATKQTEGFDSSLEFYLKARIFSDPDSQLQLQSFKKIINEIKTHFISREKTLNDISLRLFGKKLTFKANESLDLNTLVNYKLLKQ